MSYKLNTDALQQRLVGQGLKQSDLAEKLGVSREAVSKWVSGEAVPTPDKLLRIGLVLESSYADLVLPDVALTEPVVYFRRKRGRKTKDQHLDGARDRGNQLKNLVPYLKDRPLTRPPILAAPRPEYSYVQKVAATLRKEMGIRGTQSIGIEHVTQRFSDMQSIIVPVMWGAKKEHGNALNVQLPDSGTMWVFLNLDSSTLDFKFWMIHELGHSLAPQLTGDDGEDFADRLAQAVLFPEPEAQILRDQLKSLSTTAHRIKVVRDLAEERGISPLTIRLALHDFEDQTGEQHTDLGEAGAFMGTVQNVAKRAGTMAEHLFGSSSPEPQAYVSETTSKFDTPFFPALAGYCREHDNAEQLIHGVLGLPLVDAKALSGELRDRG